MVEIVKRKEAYAPRSNPDVSEIRGSIDKLAEAEMEILQSNAYAGSEDVPINGRFGIFSVLDFERERNPKDVAKVYEATRGIVGVECLEAINYLCDGFPQLQSLIDRNAAYNTHSRTLPLPSKIKALGAGIKAFSRTLIQNNNHYDFNSHTVKKNSNFIPERQSKPLHHSIYLMGLAKSYLQQGTSINSLVDSVYNYLSEVALYYDLLRETALQHTNTLYYSSSIRELERDSKAVLNRLKALEAFRAEVQATANFKAKKETHTWLIERMRQLINRTDSYEANVNSKNNATIELFILYVAFLRTTPSDETLIALWNSFPTDIRSQQISIYDALNKTSPDVVKLSREERVEYYLKNRMDFNLLLNRTVMRMLTGHIGLSEAELLPFQEILDTSTVHPGIGVSNIPRRYFDEILVILGRRQDNELKSFIARFLGEAITSDDPLNAIFSPNKPKSRIRRFLTR